MNTAVVDVQFDAQEMIAGAEATTICFKEIEISVRDVETAVSRTFSAVLDCLDNMTASVNLLTDSLKSAAEMLGNLMAFLTAQQTENEWFDGVAMGIESISTAINGISLGVMLKTSELGIVNFLKPIGTALLKGIKWLGTILFSKVGAIIVGIPALAVGIYDAIVSGIDWINAALISAGATATGAGIGAIIGALGGPITAGIGALIGVGVGVVTDFAILIVQNWDAIKAAIGTAAEWINTNVIQPVVGFFTELWKSITGIVSGIWDGVVSVVSGAAQWFYDNVISPVMEIFSPIVEWYAQLFRSIWQTVSDVFHNIGVIASGCWDVIVAVWSIVSSWFNDNVIQPVVSFFSGLWSSITAFASDAWTAIQNTFQAVGTWFYQNVIAPVAGFFSGLWDGFKKAAANAWEGVKNVFSAVGGFFKDVFSSAWEKVVSVFSAAGNIFVNIKDAIVSVFKSVVNGIINGLNSIIAVPFKGINGALTLVKNIEILGLQPFSGLQTISVPQIPLLARGAVLPANRPFMAIVGDQKHGTNIEAPLAAIKQTTPAGTSCG